MLGKYLFWWVKTSLDISWAPLHSNVVQLIIYAWLKLPSISANCRVLFNWFNYVEGEY